MFTRLYFHNLLQDIGANLEITMASGLEHAFSLKTKEGRFTPIYGEISDSEGMPSTERLVSRSFDVADGNEIVNHVLVFLSTNENGLQIRFHQVNSAGCLVTTTESLDFLAERMAIEIYVVTILRKFGIQVKSL